MKKMLLAFFLVNSIVYGQTILAERVKGIRVTGRFDANFPIALINSQPIKISFDVDTPHPEYFRIRFIHCDKDWNTTQTSFINDYVSNTPLIEIPYAIAPVGVKHYQWTYEVELPGFAGVERFSQSGNYRFEIWNRELTELVATGKFFVAEQKDDAVMSVVNYELPSSVFPWNQSNKIGISYTLPQSDYNEVNPIIINFVRTADVYKNREFGNPCRIDIDDRDNHTFIDGWGTKKLKFIVDNILPGNEYRILDIRNANQYPPSEVLRNPDGADISRFLHQDKPDNNGTSSTVEGTRFADYEQYQFEVVRPEEQTNEKIFVVGDFNGWKMDNDWLLYFHSGLKHYTVTKWLRRGVYNYQYILDGDWFALEGNDWRTVNVYTAFIYYHDQRFGGFDRILLCCQAKSPGGTEGTK